MDLFLCLVSLSLSNWKPIGKEKADTPAAHPSADSLPQPTCHSNNTPTVIYCWRCKGSHAPRSCPSYNLNSRSKSANNPNSRQPNHSQPHHSQQSSNSPQPRPLPTQTIESQNKASVGLAHTEQSAQCHTCFTGMVWDVAGRVYWFSDDELRKYPFCEESSPWAYGEASKCIFFFFSRSSTGHHLVAVLGLTRGHQLSSEGDTGFPSGRTSETLLKEFTF